VSLLKYLTAKAPFMKRAFYLAPIWIKTTFSLAVWLTAPFFFTSCLTDRAKVLDKSLESGFITPLDSMHTSVYWYWISDNISKEGVIADLRVMKKAGINRAFQEQLIILTNSGWISYLKGKK